MGLDYLEKIFLDLQKDINFLRTSKDEDAKWGVIERLKIEIEMLVDNVEFLKRMQEMQKGA